VCVCVGAAKKCSKYGKSENYVHTTERTQGMSRGGRTQGDEVNWEKLNAQLGLVF